MGECWFFNKNGECIDKGKWKLRQLCHDSKEDRCGWNILSASKRIIQEMYGVFLRITKTQTIFPTRLFYA